MAQSVSLDHVLDLAKQLSAVDQVRLIEHLTPQIARAVAAAHPTPRRSLRGLWQGLDIADADIAEVRREMWGNFPRQDL